ncbi:DUF5753 domain-containing protein [Actinocorallia aurantiaca]|uniref:DUF5753 domain-containing protein n=1 Tax=Actinocorallia aurantiaca TaxID=46204 RepID=A0ABP6GK75_9ACTN
MNEQERVAVANGFRAALGVAVDLATPEGLLSLQKFSEKAQRILARRNIKIMVLADSTVSDNLNKSTSRLPKRYFVQSLIRVLRMAIGEWGGDPDMIGTLRQWTIWYNDTVLAMSSGRPAPEIVLPRQVGTRVPLSLVHGGTDVGKGLGGSWRADPPPDPWEEYGDAAPDRFRRYLDLEREARVFKVYEPRTVPELLQTRDYARAVIAHALPDASEETVRRHVALRMRRFELLYRRPDRPVGWFLLEKAALFHPAVSPEVMQDQYRALLRAMSSRRVTLQVRTSLPRRSAPAGEAMTILRFADGGRSDIVYLPADGPTGTARGSILDQPEDFQEYAVKFANIGRDSKGEDSSRTFIEGLRT